MDMSVFNFSDPIRVSRQRLHDDSSLILVVTETALDLSNIEVAIESFLEERVHFLDVTGRAKLARIREAVSQLAARNSAAAKIL